MYKYILINNRGSIFKKIFFLNLKMQKLFMRFYNNQKILFREFYLDFSLQRVIKIKRRAVINRANCSSREIKIERCVIKPAITD